MTAEKHCEICGGPNDMTVHFKTSNCNETVPIVMCYECFMDFIRARENE